MDRTSQVASIGELLQEAARQLRDAGIPSPREEARLLMAEALGRPVAWVMAHPEETPPPGGYDLFLAYLNRRTQYEPVAYILGHKEFYGLDFEVGRDVLIPRPETELLVERAIAACRQLLAVRGRDLLVADLGTGSGAVAVAVATHIPHLRILAVDSSEKALEVARVNAARHGVRQRISFHKGDLLADIDGPLDLVVANLPYIPSGVAKALMPDVSLYEPHEALDGGPDGTGLIREALEQAVGKMSIPSMLLYEIGDGQGAALAEAARRYYPEAAVRVEQDYAGFERILSVQLIGWC